MTELGRLVPKKYIHSLTVSKQRVLLAWPTYTVPLLDASFKAIVFSPTSKAVLTLSA